MSVSLSPSLVNFSDSLRPPSSIRDASSCTYSTCDIPSAMTSYSSCTNVFTPISTPISPVFPDVPNLGIHNLSSRVLSSVETFVLGLGLKFCISKDPLSDEEILSAHDSFVRSVRLRAMFGNNNFKISPFRIPNPSFVPEPAPRAVEDHLVYTRNNLIEQLQRFPSSSFQRSPTDIVIQRSLRSLRLDNSIVIKPADKNLGTVVVDTSWYIEEALKQLLDADVYSPMINLPSVEMVYNYAANALKMAGYFSKNNSPIGIAKFILHGRANLVIKPATFYLIIKVHKSPVVGRPICSSIGTATHNASIWLDAQLQPLLCRIPAYLRDSKSLVYSLESSSFPTSCILLTADITALYPSIPIVAGLKALQRFVVDNIRDEKICTLIMSLAYWVLNSNFIQFGDKIFLQKQGTAMGTPFAVAFAVIFLGDLESQLNRNNINIRPLFLKRYIDDIFAVFNTRAEANSFLQAYDSFYPSIKTTHSMGDSVSFLDLQISKGNRFISTNCFDLQVHQKDLNKYLYIPTFSFHPPSIFKAFIKAEIQRFRFICSDEDQFQKTLDKFSIKLMMRGYNIDSFQQEFSHPPSRKDLMDSFASKGNALLNSSSSASVRNPLLFKTNWNIRYKKVKLSSCFDFSYHFPSDHVDAVSLFNSTKPIICYSKAVSAQSIVAPSKLKLILPSFEQLLENKKKPDERTPHR